MHDFIQGKVWTKLLYSPAWNPGCATEKHSESVDQLSDNNHWHVRSRFVPCFPSRLWWQDGRHAVSAGTKSLPLLETFDGRPHLVQVGPARTTTGPPLIPRHTRTTLRPRSALYARADRRQLNCHIACWTLISLKADSSDSDRPAILWESRFVDLLTIKGPSSRHHVAAP